MLGVKALAFLVLYERRLGRLRKHAWIHRSPLPFIHRNTSYGVRLLFPIQFFKAHV